MRPQVSGVEPGQRHLNGPQTTGREFRNLSQPTYTMMEDDDVEAPMRDGVHLLVESKLGRATSSCRAAMCM
jgi:uncharacterized protein